jgi:hypothetical protein
MSFDFFLKKKEKQDNEIKNIEQVFNKENLCVDDLKILNLNLNKKIFIREFIDLNFSAFGKYEKNVSYYATITEVVLLKSFPENNSAKKIKVLIEAGADMDIIDNYQLSLFLRDMYLYSNSINLLSTLYTIISARKKPFDHNIFLQFVSRYFQFLIIKNEKDRRMNVIYYLCLTVLLSLGQEIDQDFFKTCEVKKNTNSCNILLLSYCLKKKNYYIWF